MNGRQAPGCGISAQETTNTIAKKAANSIVGKLTEVGPGSHRDVGVAAAQVLRDRLAHPAPLVRARHSVAAEQLLLRLERQPGDLPAHREPLEEQLQAALPAVLGRGRRLRVELGELAQCAV